MNASNLVSAWTGAFRNACRRFWRFPFAMVLASALNASGADYYVATDGDDTHDGTTLATPLATLQTAIGKAAAGDTIHVRGGTYRQQVTATTGGGTADAYLTIQAYGDEKPVFKGSDQVTGWEHHEGAIWKKTGWTINSQQVFCNERYLQQIGLPHVSYTPMHYTPVGTGLADMVAGSFYYDATTATLYVWLHESSDPNVMMMEASTKKWVMGLGIPFIHSKGLTFRHCNSSGGNPGGQGVLIGPDSIIEECDIQWCDFEGLELSNSSQALRCIISNNGDVGVGAGGSESFVIRGCTINDNNYRNFNPWWHAGGLKIVAKAYGTVEENEISRNNACGIWFDGCNSENPIVIRNNILRENAKVAIFVEISRNALVYSNLLLINPYAGICINGSDNTHCYHNTIGGTGGHAAISLDGVPRTGFTLKNNQIFNNIVFGSTAAYDLIIPQDNGGDTQGNTSDYNCFFRTDGVLKLSNGRQTYSSLDTWRATTGFDLQSINADPRFNLTTADDYSTSTMSPVVDAGMDLPEVTTDIRGQPRPQGAASDMGAFETYWQDTEHPTAPLNMAAVLITWNSVRVSWSPASDNVGVARYQVYRDEVLCAETTGKEFFDTGLAALTTYQYGVIAIDDAGLKSPMSDVIAILTGPLPESMPPSPPQKLSVANKTASEVSITWKAATDNVGVTEYWIYRDGQKVGVSGMPGFTDRGLKPRTYYNYRVSALDAVGNQSKLSKILTVRTLRAPTLSVIEQWRLDNFGTTSDSEEAADAFD
ncbi:MAG: hypothetical protein RLZZ214_4155, partial [Verrucomicrobiota bacterium]